MRMGIEVIAHERYVKHAGLPEERLAVFIELTQLAHVLVQFNEHAVPVVERHSNLGGVEQLEVLAGQLAVSAFLLNIRGHIFYRA